MRQRSAPLGCTPRLAALAVLVAALGAAGLLLLYQVPAIHDRLHWRVQTAWVAVIELVRPRPETLATPLPAPTSAALAELLASPTPAPAASARPSATAAPATGTPPPTQPPTPAATPLPVSALVNDVPRETQGWNNCGPATLSMNLGYWGWAGDQYDAAAWLKPNGDDKNVSPGEIQTYVANYTSGLEAAVRAGGTLDLLRGLLANGYPVMVAKGVWHGDQGWVGHYLLLTGYDDAAQEFTVNDSLSWDVVEHVPYDQFDVEWQMFNRLLVLVYPEAQAEEVMALLGQHAEAAGSYRLALETARAELQAEPGNAFVWNNLGTSLDYFEDYDAAALAFDEARRIGLPFRLLWYQTAQYSAYYNVGRYQDVIDLASTAQANTLGTADLEESLYWRGRAKSALGDAAGARRDFERVLAFNPNFEAASRALAELEEAGT